MTDPEPTLMGVWTVDCMSGGAAVSDEWTGSKPLKRKRRLSDFRKRFNVMVRVAVQTRSLIMGINVAFATNLNFRRDFKEITSTLTHFRVYRFCCNWESSLFVENVQHDFFFLHLNAVSNQSALSKNEMLMDAAKVRGRHLLTFSTAYYTSPFTRSYMTKIGQYLIRQVQIHFLGNQSEYRKRLTLLCSLSPSDWHCAVCLVMRASRKAGDSV